MGLFPFGEEAGEGRFKELRQAAPEEGAVGHEAAPPLTRQEASEERCRVLDADEDLEDHLVRQQSRRPFHRWLK